MSEEGTSSPSSSFGSDTLIEPEIDFTKTSFDGITDSDLFNYFLSDDIVGSNHDLLTITSHSFEASSDSNQSPQPSPPQLSPEVNEFGVLTDSSPTQISVFDTNGDVPLIPIKQETLAIPPTKKQSRKRDRSTKDTTTTTREELSSKLNRGADANNSITISNKQLSVDEEKQLKRQKRLIKNRESAQLSRLRKKIYIEELERKVSTLTSETESLSKQVGQLQTDNKKLQGEVVYLQNIIKQSPELSVTLSKRGTSTTTTVIPAKNMKAAGVCLLIVLFSVGLLFNSKEHNASRIFKNTPSSSTEDIPQIVTTKTTRSVYTGRVLKSIEDNSKFTLSKEDTSDSTSNTKVIPSISDLPPVKTETSSTIVPTPQLSKKHDIHSISLNEEEEEEENKEVIRIEDNRITLEATSNKVINDRRKRMKIENEPSSTTSTTSTTSEESMGLVPAASTSFTIPTSDVILQRNPSASYIYCPEAHHIAPSITNSGASEMIALLIPASVLNSTLVGNNTLDTSLLEISCSVLNLHMWPLNNRATN